LLLLLVVLIDLFLTGLVSCCISRGFGLCSVGGSGPLLALAFLGFLAVLVEKVVQILSVTHLLFVEN